MLQKSTDHKPDIDRLGPVPEASASSFSNGLTSASSSKQQAPQQQHQAQLPSHQHHHHHYYNHLGHSPKEDVKSQRARASNFHSLSHSHQAQQHLNQQVLRQNSNNNYDDNDLSERNGQHQLTRSTTNPQLHQHIPPNSHHRHQQQYPTQSSQSTMAFKTASSSISENIARSSNHLTNPPVGSVHMANNSSGLAECKTKTMVDESKVPINGQQVEKAPDGINGTLSQNDSGANQVDLDTLGSLERTLPIELSFLIRQQAYCMARMNYLDRQIKELKESRQAIPSHNNSATAINQSQSNHKINMSATHIKNGNFIHSDDSGGEYSRATLSDDDELSSLLDQIAKSVRPEHRSASQSINNQATLQHQRPSHSILSGHPQPYAIINPGQLHPQAVPVFVMGSPIAVAHPSSIRSNVLPGVHFQPEPRYNQYYEDFYVHSTPTSSSMHRHPASNLRSQQQQQLDNSISTIEHLVGQKEKRQIKSQLETCKMDRFEHASNETP